MSQCYAKSRQMFTGSTASSKNPRFLAMNHDIVPCTPAGLRSNGKPMAVKFTIIRPVSEGFAGAPFKNKDTKRDPESRCFLIAFYVFHHTHFLLAKNADPCRSSRSSGRTLHRSPS